MKALPYYLAAATLLALIPVPMPVEAGSNHKGARIDTSGLNTNAQRFAKGLPPKPIRFNDPHAKRGIRPRQSPRPPQPTQPTETSSSSSTQSTQTTRTTQKTTTRATQTTSTTRTTQTTRTTTSTTRTTSTTSSKPPPAQTSQPLKQTRSVVTPGGSCGCSYTVMTNTAVVYPNPSSNFEASETKDSWNECLKWGDEHASCWSVTYDGKTGLCSVWNDEPERNMKLVANTWYAVYNTGASECDYRSCGIQ